jgi:glycosyltransferase involved in cell wall biosynthesis
MKVAILSFYSGLVSRGVETFVTELSAHLKGKVDLKVYQADSVGIKLEPKPDTTGKISRYLFLDYYSLKIKQFTQSILERLAGDPPDIIMALNNGWMSLLTKQFCRQHKTKLVLAGFSGIGWDDKVNLWLKPDCFIVCTKWQAGWAKGINSQCKIVTINIGVNTERFKPEGKKYQHGLKPPVILVVAGPQTFKRVELAIEAVHSLNDVSLLVVGEQREAINNLGGKLLGERYKNVQVGYEKLDSVYRACQAYTLPSGSGEAYGISILEAMASGLPVVVNDDPIRRELVGDVGILVDPTNEARYVAGLKLALKSSVTAARQRNFRGRKSVSSIWIYGRVWSNFPTSQAFYRSPRLERRLLCQYRQKLSALWSNRD